MKCAHAIERLRAAEDTIRQRGVAHLFIFGSTATDLGGAQSDLDVFIDREPGAALGLMELEGLSRMLEDLVGTRVDLGTRKGLHPLIRDEVERNAIRVF